MATNKVQCPYGHFYNPDKYVDCPICNKSLLSSFNAQTSVTPQRETTASRSQFEETPDPSPAPVRNSGTYRPTSSVFGNQYEDTSTHPVASFKTVSIMNDNQQASPDAPAIVIPESIPNLAQEISQEPIYVASSAPPVFSTLQAAVNAVVSHKDTEDVKTVAMWNAPAGIDPVVGWLVCVKGEYFGQSFNLKAGNNTVGRAMNMDIPLAQEPSVSRNKHCVITYEPLNQVFYIQQGESSGLTYLNGEMVMFPTKMKEQDRIKLGTVELLLIPFCTNGFRWEEYSV